MQVKMLRFVATIMVVAVLLVNVILWSIYYLNREIKGVSCQHSEAGTVL